MFIISNDLTTSENSLALHFAYHLHRDKRKCVDIYVGGMHFFLKMSKLHLSHNVTSMNKFTLKCRLQFQEQ